METIPPADVRPLPHPMPYVGRQMTCEPGFPLEIDSIEELEQFNQEQIDPISADRQRRVYTKARFPYPQPHRPNNQSIEPPT